VSAEWFLKLKEYDSLEKMKNGLLKAINDQEGRLSILNKKRQEQKELENGLKTELHSLQQDYFETEKKLNTSEEQAQRLRDIGGDQEKIEKFVVEASSFEAKLFSHLEKIELLQAGLEEKKTFLAGLDKTILEISSEVKEEINKHQQDLTQLELRLTLIKDELPLDFKVALEKTLKKNLAIGPFTRVDNGSCYFCRFKISRVDESEIDMQKNLKFCPQCLRIFLPYGS
jgi:predicted  nucleic acid-binding Zn-ribbon protein